MDHMGGRRWFHQRKMIGIHVEDNADIGIGRSTWHHQTQREWTGEQSLAKQANRLGMTCDQNHLAPNRARKGPRPEESYARSANPGEEPNQDASRF